jgi:hypothetical protein
VSNAAKRDDGGLADAKVLVEDLKCKALEYFSGKLYIFLKL